MKKIMLIGLGLILISFLFGIYVYPQMPEKMASHWNAKGEVNGYMSKFWALFLMPFFSIGLFLLFIFIPKIDPLKKNVEKFRKYFDWFILIFIGFMVYIYSLTILWNFGYRFSMARVLAPAFGILFFYLGILMEKSKRNWFIGIRTPWTLSNDVVWEKTHKLGGKLFKFTGIVAFFGILFERFFLFFVLFPLFLGVFYLIIYSYIEYKKQTKK